MSHGVKTNFRLPNYIYLVTHLEGIKRRRAVFSGEERVSRETGSTGHLIS